MRAVIGCILLMVTASLADIFLDERFNDKDGWVKRWVESTSKGDDAGKFILSSGKFFGDVEKDVGIQTSQDAKFYGLSTKLSKPLNMAKDDLVVQFTVKHEQSLDCGGGYIKLFDCSMDPASMHGESPYKIMFGPDICGPSTKRVHVIFNNNGENHLIKKEIRCKDDEFTHLYTLIVKASEGTYQVLIDNEVSDSGKLAEDWSMMPSKQIKDPKLSKPAEWIDLEQIADPEDSKPEDWEQPEHIADPEATKPEDWDEEMDGEWEPAMIDNSDYKGEWEPRQIDNPEYKGKWVHPMIDNPEYNVDDAGKLGKYDEICQLGFDLWQVKSGTIFDNVLISNDVEEAKKIAEETFGLTKGPEKEMKDAHDSEERKRMEEENKEAGDDEPEEAEDDEDDLDELDDDEAPDASHDEL